MALINGVHNNMPGSLIGECLKEFVLRPALEVGCHVTGRWVLSTFTGGRVKPMEDISSEAKLCQRKPIVKPACQALFYKKGCDFYLASDCVSLAGLLFWILLGLVAWGIWTFFA